MSIPFEAFPYVAFAFGTLGLISAWIWSRALDRQARRENEPDHWAKFAGSAFGPRHPHKHRRLFPHF